MSPLSPRTGWSRSRCRSFALGAYPPLGPDGENQQEFQKVMEGYHELISPGRREAYTIEG